MRPIATFVLAILAMTGLSGQSPFNYGQNKSVYFISSELRKNFTINTIYVIDQRYENDLGGMNENWDITVIDFDTNFITDDWTPLSLDTAYHYNFDSITQGLHYLNGDEYDFSNGQLSAYGGSGYGSFEWKDIRRFSDTISIITTSCNGHCGNVSLKYSKNIFTKQGLLLYTINYPDQSEEIDDGSGMTINNYETLLNSTLTEGNFADTVYYSYNSRGLLLTDPEDQISDDSLNLKSIFKSEWYFSNFKFHQCYAGKEKMETYINKKLGYVPDLLLLEVYQYGIFSFTLNPSDKKYYRTKSIILER